MSAVAEFGARAMSTGGRVLLDRWVERVLTAQTLDEVFAA